jgi:N6-L-threonylcarbamoyladenine synthase
LKILAIETSCDETAAAVVEDGARVLSSVVSSQAALHAPYGGVVPELASRHHIENVCPATERALADAGVDLERIDVVAVTQGPGLIGSLLVGLQFAKGIAFVRGLPLVPVHHIAGHLEAPFLTGDDVELPALALVVSGGHTSLIKMPARGTYILLGRTRDDAAGEAFDKVAKLLGLGYPGGPVIDRVARNANDRAVEFTTAKMSDGRPDFSFSGLKTAVLHHVRRHGIAPADDPENVSKTIGDLVASFQRGVVTSLLRRLREAAERERPRSLLLTGGVAANTALRREAAALAADLGLPLHVPPFHLTTDNAAMIGAAGFIAHRRGVRADWSVDAEARLPLA